MTDDQGGHGGGELDLDQLWPQRGADPSSRPVLRDRCPLEGGAFLAVFDAGDEVLVAPLAAGHDSIRRALPGEGAYEGMLSLIRDGGGIGDFVARRGGDVPTVVGERRIDVDQSNDSVVVGERVVVKLYPRSAPGPQPGLDLPAHLAEVGFADTPAALGALRWEPPDREPVLLATASAYLPSARDGWAWYLELVLAALDAPDDTARAAAALAPASSLGRLVARFHVALATPSSVLGRQPVRRADAHRMRSWRREADAKLDRALGLTGGAEGARLAALAGAIRGAFDAFDRVDATPIMRVHGDLHVGQVLRWDGGDMIADMDGNPLAPSGSRVARHSPALDVASFVRSLDHLGRVAQRRRAEREGAVEVWIGRSRHAFLHAYRTELGRAGHAGLFDERLLHPFEVAQECHEYVYAATYLPRWLPVPDLALPHLVGAGPRAGPSR